MARVHCLLRLFEDAKTSECTFLSVRDVPDAAISAIKFISRLAVSTAGFPILLIMSDIFANWAIFLRALESSTKLKTFLPLAH